MFRCLLILKGCYSWTNILTLYEFIRRTVPFCALIHLSCWVLWEWLVWHLTLASEKKLTSFLAQTKLWLWVGQQGLVGWLQGRWVKWSMPYNHTNAASAISWYCYFFVEIFELFYSMWNDMLKQHPLPPSSFQGAISWKGLNQGFDTSYMIV